MKKKPFFVLGLMILLLLSCQKGQAPEEKKQVEIPKTEVKQPQPVEERSIDQSKQQMQQVAPEEQTKKEVEGPSASRPSPLTEEEQKEFETLGGGWQTPNVFKTEKQALKFLRILVKGDEKTIRWYQETRLTDSKKEEEEKAARKLVYSQDLETALSAVNTKINKEGFNLAVQVLKAKRDYPEALARAAEKVKLAHDPDVIPVLREIAKHPIPSVRLEVGGSLLSLGDADTALPVLDELAEKEGYTGALYYLFRKPGEIIDERGYKIVEKALHNPKADVSISATKLLLESGRIGKQKAEDIASSILEKFMDKTEKDYGIGRRKIPGKRYSEIYVLPGYEGKRLDELEKLYNSDGRACDKAMQMLGELRSKKAIPLLRIIKETHKDVGWVCWENAADRTAEKALEKITGEGK